MSATTHLEQTEKVAQNARTGWFVFMSLLMFVGVIMMSHSDTDFFAYGTETRLPLINLSVPTVSFFVVAPGLILALYTYLHIYLTSLWRILAALPDQITNDSPEKHVYPALLCVSAFRLRQWIGMSDKSSVEGRTIAMFAITISVTWLIGPIMVFFLWWLSTPYHNLFLSLWIALCVWTMMSVGLISFLDLVSVFQFGPKSLLRNYRSKHRRLDVALKSTLVLTALLLMLFSWTTTRGGFLDYQEYSQDERTPPRNFLVGVRNNIFSLVSADLTWAELSRKPQQWSSYENWATDWTRWFLERERISFLLPIEKWSEELFRKYTREIVSRWSDSTSSLNSPKLERIDLRGAHMEFAFLSGADLRGARLDGARLRRSHVEGVNFVSAQLVGAGLIEAQAQGADFSSAQLRGARFFRAHAQGASFARARAQSVDFREARLQLANLARAQLEKTEFHSARMLGADLSWSKLRDSAFIMAKLQLVNFNGAKLQNATLFGANLERATFVAAQMQGADLRESRLVEVDFRGASMENVDLARANVERVNFRGVDLSEVRNLTQFHVDRSFGTSLTELPPDLAKPCHWDSTNIVGLTEDWEFKEWIRQGAVSVPQFAGGGCP